MQRQMINFLGIPIDNLFKIVTADIAKGSEDPIG